MKKWPIEMFYKYVCCYILNYRGKGGIKIYVFQSKHLNLMRPLGPPDP